MRPHSVSLLPWLLAALLMAAVGAVLWGGWRAGLLEGKGGVLLYFVLLGALLNAGLFALLLAVWARLVERRDQRQRLDRELRYLRGQAGEEGRLRKEGLIRDLNALGAAPTDLEQTTLAEADLKGADLRGCNLKGADLHGADLQGALLDRADLFGAELAGANLTRATLVDANLRGCNLEGATLEKASLGAANCHRANLVDTNLHGVDLSRARLERARFARPDAGGFPREVHPSVEDWIRARLDKEGRYAPPNLTP